MSSNSVQEFIFASRPKGLPNSSTFKKQAVDLKPLADGDVQLEPVYYSVDPYMRGRMNDGPSYIEPFEVGQPLVGGAIAKVTKSKSQILNEGDLVSGMLPWATQAVVRADELQKIESHRDHASLHLGLLGMPGMTAYFGFLDIGLPKKGETVVISGAAGAVGSAVGQIAKIKGCRVIGIAGSDEKAQLLKDEYKFDDVINYKTTKDLTEAIRAACPNGVDIYFDNVGGETSDAVIANMNNFGRIPLCGQIALYNSTEAPQGPRVQVAALTKRLTIRGFIVFDFQERFAEAQTQLTQWYDQGLLKTEETVTEGFEKLPEALLGLFSGKNTGKMIVKA